MQYHIAINRGLPAGRNGVSRHLFPRLLRTIGLLGLSIALCSCSTLSFYKQSIAGQMELLSKRRPIAEISTDPDIPEQLKTVLNRVLEIRDFASNVLHLPDNDSYRSYADLGRPFVVWNVVAAPALSLQPLQWCYLIAGCLSYRGYFSKQDAINHAIKLKAKGYDVYVGGVRAYSTLGWFDDPLLNTMLRYDTVELAKLIFHELAHQKIYITNDTEFNEAFAESVALIGVRRWLRAHGNAGALYEFEQSHKRESEFIQLVRTYKNKLEMLYSSDLPDQSMHAGKITLFREMADDYQRMRSHWGGYDDYDAWFEDGLNNAKLAAILTYKDLVPKLMALFAAEGGNLQRFYCRIEQLAHHTPAERRSIFEENKLTGLCQQR